MAAIGEWLGAGGFGGERTVVAGERIVGTAKGF